VNDHSLRIGMVVGEASGDILGAGLMAAIRARHPRVRFEGIGGPRMEALGFVSFYRLDRLSVMGFVDPLKRLPELLRMRRNLVADFLRDPPDLFIGIDSPDFNLGLELQLRGAGIRTAHYVSPSVWAWRQGRVRKIARAVDLMLTLFPFEAAFYERHGVPVRFVGHPLADAFELVPDTAAARRELGVGAAAPVIAVLPGSRGGEVSLLAPGFIEAMNLLAARFPGAHFLLPAANAERREQLAALLPALLPADPAREARFTLLDGRSREAMTAADVVLMASGTTTLEAMLLKKPMVVAYRLSPLSFRLLKRIVKVEHIALPNLLAGAAMVPELLQDEATPAALSGAVARWLEHDDERRELVARFTELHRQLRQDASANAAEAVLALLPPGRPAT